MKVRRIFTILICIIFFTLTFVGCSNKNSSVSFFVKGQIEYDVELADIEVLLNGKSTEKIKINADGTFEVSDLSQGDIISFLREGYVFDEITVGENSIEGLVIVPRILSYEITVDKQGEGEITGVGTAVYGSEIALKFSPAAHFRFAGLYEGEALITADTEYKLTVKSGVNYTAVFAPIEYPISVNKNYAEGKVTATKCAVFGEEITLAAESDDKYVFAKWIVDGIEITDKTYKFVLNNENPNIIAVFTMRLDKPVIIVQNGIVQWKAVAGASGYNVTVDGDAIYTTDCGIDMYKAGLSTGSHSITVEAIGAGYCNSFIAEKTFDYIRPLDTPKSAGIVLDGDDVWFVFSKVLGAASYDIIADGEYSDLSNFTYTETVNDIKVKLNALLIKNKTYSFAVRAADAENSKNSAPSATVNYINILKLSKPTATITGEVLSYSHEDESVEFSVIFNGISVYKGTEKSLKITDFLEENSAEIIVLAEKEGYVSAETKLTYEKL